MQMLFRYFGRPFQVMFDLQDFIELDWKYDLILYTNNFRWNETCQTYTHQLHQENLKEQSITNHIDLFYSTRKCLFGRGGFWDVA